MITNQNMTRKMGSLDVTQRTKDGFFNATALLEQWNKTNPNEKRAIDNFWKSTHIDKLMLEIVVNEPHLLGNYKSVKSTDYKNTTENQQVSSTPKLGDDKNLDFDTLKKIVAKTSRGKNGGTWLHPVMFVKFAMYLSPRFEYHVLKFVADEMIKYRNLAGDGYKQLSTAVSTIVEKDFMKTAMSRVSIAMNYIVFGEHKVEIRNDFGFEEKQRELYELQYKITNLIEDGFIGKFDVLMSYLRRCYAKVHMPDVFQNTTLSDFQK